MTTYALIQNTVVVELIPPIYDETGKEVPITDRFTQDFTQMLVVAPANVKVGYTYQNGVFTPPTGVSPVDELATAKAIQLTVISEACQSSIYSGFTSDALGDFYSYPAKAIDQLNLLSSVESAGLAAKLSLPWAPGMSYTVDDTIIDSNVVYRAAVSGVSGSTKPNFPTILGQTVKDGLVLWDIWATPYWCADATGNWAWRPHTSWEMMRAGLDAKKQVLKKMLRNQQLAAEVYAATTVDQVKAIVW